MKNILYKNNLRVFEKRMIDRYFEDKYYGFEHTYVQRVIHKFPQQIHILSGKIQKKITTQAGRMEFFTLITQVSSRFDI